MIFRKVELENFLSFKEAKIILDNQGFVSVRGQNLTDETASSNGSGKSSWVEAIVWALTGQTIRGVSAVQNLYATSGDCKVRLFFEQRGNSYVIERVKGKTLNIFKNGVDISGKGIRDTQELINDLFPNANIRFLSSTTVLGQGMPFRFTNNKPAGRKEELEQLTQADFQIEDLKNKLTTLKTLRGEKLRAVEDDILRLNASVEILERQNISLDRELNALPDREGLIKQLEELEFKLNPLIILNTTLSADLIAARESQDLFNAELLSETQKDSKVKQEKYEEKQKELNVIILEKQKGVEETATLKQVLREVKSSLQDDIEVDCPQCGSHFHLQKDVEALLSKKEAGEKRLSELLEISQGIETQIQNIQRKQQDILNAENLKLLELQEKVKQAKERVNELDFSYTSTSSELRSIESQKTKLLNTLENLDMERLRLTNQVKENAGKILTALEESLPKLKEKQLHVQNEIQYLNKLYSFATKEFRGILLADTVQLINENVKKLSYAVFGNCDIDIFLDGTNINITYLGNEFEASSGGEKQAIDILIQLALRNALLTLREETSNILICDEILDNLDTERANKVIELISLQGLETCFFISHHGDELQLPYDKQLLIVKENRISRVCDD